MNKMQQYLNSFREDYPGLGGLSDDAMFSAMCAKYYFFANPRNESFSAEGFEGCITDGKNDGGVDALFRNPDLDSSEIVILQCKYYAADNPLSERAVKSEMDKIIATIAKLRSGNLGRLNQRVKQAYSDAMADFDSVSDVCWRIAFMTSWVPSSAELRKAIINKAKSYAGEHISVEVRFGDDILVEAEDFGREDEYCARGELALFGRGGTLKFNGASVVNVSARSLARLAKMGKSVLGLNLRYHISNKAADRRVDEGMGKTMRDRPDDFWYFNNGIVIVCGGYSISGGVIRLHKFSIVNGGQTTMNVKGIYESENGISRDFPVLCKIIRMRGRGDRGKAEFCNEIAEFTNSQKPIKIADLKANRPEQRQLQKRLANCGVFYVRKAGDVPSKQYRSWLVAGMERIGKLGLAGVMLMPAEARNKLTVMFDDEICYNGIFRAKVDPRVYADLLVLSKAYQSFRRMIARQQRRGRWFDDLGEEVVQNAETFVLAAIGFFAKIDSGALGIKKYRSARRKGDRDYLNKSCGRSVEVERIIGCEYDESNPEFDYLFFEICKIIRDAYRRELRKDSDTPDVSHWMKKTDVFHDLITNALYRKYSQPTSNLRHDWKKLHG